MVSTASAEKRTKMILKTLGIICMVGGILLMFSRYYYRDAFPVESDTTVFYISTFGGFGLIMVGFVLLRFSKRVIPRDEAPMTNKDQPAQIAFAQKSAKSRKGEKKPGIKVGRKAPEPRYERSKMNKFLIDPEDMKKK